MYFSIFIRCISLIQPNVFLSFQPYFLVFSIKIWSGMRGWLLCVCSKKMVEERFCDIYFSNLVKCISLIQQNVFLGFFKPYFLAFSIKIWSGMRGWLCLCVWGKKKGEERIIGALSGPQQATKQASSLLATLTR